MVNLPLKKNLAPITSSIGSVTAIMSDMKRQQDSLSSLVGGLTNVNSMFSDDLVSATNNINNIMAQTTGIYDKLTKQQTLLNSSQLSSSINSTKLVSSLSSEVTAMKNVASTITSQVKSLNSIIDGGTVSGQSIEKISGEVKNSIAGFSSKATDLISGLDSHSAALTSAISSIQSKTIGGLTSSLDSIGNIGSSLPDLSSISSQLTDKLGGLDSLADLDTGVVTREVDQKFAEISDVLSGTLDNLKSSVVDAISSKISSVADFKAVTQNIDGAIASATSNLETLKNPMSALGDVTSKISGITDGIQSSLGSVTSQAIGSFTDQMSKIGDITSKMESLGGQINGGIDNLTSTVTGAVNDIGGFNPLTGITGGVSSLTNIVDPAKLLSSNLIDMNNLSHDLLLNASSLNQFAVDLPGNSAITDLSSQLTTIANSIYTKTAGTPDTLSALADVTTEPNLNLGSIEKVIINTGSDLMLQPSSSVNLNVNVDKMTSDLVDQILAISNNINSVPGS